jgi:hypothetical protein
LKPWTGLRLEFIPIKTGAGEPNLRCRPFSSFRRKPESSGIKEEFGDYAIMALLVTALFYHTSHQWYIELIADIQYIEAVI